MTTNRTTLALESLDDRRVPATLNLTSAGAQGTLTGNNGHVAHFSQLGAGAVTQPTTEFLRLHESSFLGSLLTPEEGYNTSARPLQLDASNAGTKSLLLKDVPLVTVGGTQYREFLLTVNQPAILPTIDLEELRIFANGNGNLSGYNTNNDRLAGLNAVFNLDGSGNDTVRINDLNRSGGADVRVLIPAAVFGTANPDSTYVYLYSKFSAFIGTTAVSGAESWSVRQSETTTPTDGKLSGRVSRNGEGLQGLTITLNGYDDNGNTILRDAAGNLVDELTFTTDGDGNYSFGNLAAGNYQIMISPQLQDDSFDAQLGTTTDSGTSAGDDETANVFLGIVLSTGEEGAGYNFLFDNGND